MRRKIVVIGKIKGEVVRVLRSNGGAWEVLRYDPINLIDGCYAIHRYKNGKKALKVWKGRGEKFTVLQNLYREDIF